MALSLCAIAGPAVARAQTTPVLTGSVRIDLHAGFISGDVCLRGSAAAGDTVSFALNRAYTIKRISGAHETPVLVELEPGGAALRYTYLREEREALRQPNDREGVCLEYIGSHPVYDVDRDDFADEDASSIVAFNGRNIRARGASRWYPVPFDRQTRLTSDALAFRLRVTCDACATIYVNGNPPVKGPQGDFVSRTPREILLAAGDLPQTRVNGVLILGESAQADTAVAFVATLDRIQRFYSEYLGVEYGAAPEIIRLEPIRRPRKGQLWGFFADPGLVLMGMNIQQFVQHLDGPSLPQRRAVLGFLAHELAHRYFGWTLGDRSPQRDLFGEPFATYLELKAVRALLGPADYDAALADLRDRALAGPDLSPLDEAGPDDLAIDSYRYGFAPLQLFALEQTIGEARMRTLLTALITAPAHERARADYRYLRDTALRIGVEADEWESWENRCVRKRASAARCFSSRP